MPEPPKEYRWKPGQSGNPKGRPKGTGLTDRIREKLNEADAEGVEKFIQAGIDAALSGDFRFWKEIFDRYDGPVKQVIEAEFTQAIKAIDKDAADKV